VKKPSVKKPSALVVRLEAVKRDGALRPEGRGARKILVTEIYPAKEMETTEVLWNPPVGEEKCSVQVTTDTEVAVFTQTARQDRHYHKTGTEIYMVLEGTMVIEVEGEDYTLSAGDMIVVQPGATHEVKPEGTEFLCRVVTANCGGAADKYKIA
jgi:quercetin dioxygenase-like cupin family protein